MSLGYKKNRILDYYETFQKDVLPFFNRLEPERIDAFNRFNKRTFFKRIPLIIIFYVAFLYYLGSLATTLFDSNYLYISYYFIFATFLAFILTILTYNQEGEEENLKFTANVKKKVLQSLLNVFGDIKWIQHDPSKTNEEKLLIEDHELQESGLFANYSARKTDDEFEGSYKGVSFKISEIKAKASAYSFKGVVLFFNIEKQIKNRTIVSTKGDITKKNQVLVNVITSILTTFGIIAKGFRNTKNLEPKTIILIFAIVIPIVSIATYIFSKIREKKEEALDEVILEDPKFAKRFNVYSSDQVEARYLVTPSFMERFYNLTTAFGAKKAKCSFVGNTKSTGTLMIAISTKKNLFEICSLFKSLKDPAVINDFYEELNSIYKMIDYFKLDEKTKL